MKFAEIFNIINQIFSGIKEGVKRKKYRSYRG